MNRLLLHIIHITFKNIQKRIESVHRKNAYQKKKRFCWANARLDEFDIIAVWLICEFHSSHKEEKSTKLSELIKTRQTFGWASGLYTKQFY